MTEHPRMIEHPRMTEHDKPSAADDLPTPNGDQAPDEFSRKRDTPPAQLDATEQQRASGVAGASTSFQGSGVMAARSALDESPPQREALDRAAHAARATGHRFDLLRYLRLKRARDHT
jgi:hypothetical protein